MKTFHDITAGQEMQQYEFMDSLQCYIGPCPSDICNLQLLNMEQESRDRWHLSLAMEKGECQHWACVLQQVKRGLKTFLGLL